MFSSSSPLVGLLLVAAAAASWGTTGTTLELVGASSATVPLVVGAIRMLVAAPLLAAGARVSGVPMRPRGRAFVTAGLCMAAYQVCYFSAVPLAGVAATALLAICSAPVLVTALATVVLREPVTRARLGAVALGVLGASLLVGGATPGRGAGFLAGCALALGAGVAYSLYVVATRRAVTTSAPIGLAALTFGLAAVALLPVLALEPAATATTVARAWPPLLYLGAIPTALAYWIYTTGLRRVSAGTAAVGGLVEPLTASLLGLALFRERVTLLQALGASLLLVAMAGAAVGQAGAGVGRSGVAR